MGAKGNVVIRLLYEPTAGGSATATLAIEEISADPLYHHRYEMSLTAKATAPVIFLAGGPASTIPDIELKSLDFGTIAPDATATASFWVRNVGDAPLTVPGVIENLQSNFGIVAPAILPAVLAPNAEIEVQCQFLAPPVSGRHMAGSFRVLSDDPIRDDTGDPLIPGAVLEVTGRSGGPSLLEPAEFEQGIVVVHPPAATVFTFTSDGTEAVMVREAKLVDVTPGTNFSLTSAPALPARLDPSTVLTLSVTCIATAPGMYEVDLFVTHNGNPHSSSQVRLRAIVT